MSYDKAKIVMVGGGSYTWSPCLISDLIQTPELEGCDVVLLDIDLANCLPHGVKLCKT